MAAPKPKGMRWVSTASGYLVGLVLGVGVVACAQLAFPGAEIPLTYACVAGFVLLGRPWISVPGVLCFGIGTFTSWLVGQGGGGDLPSLRTFAPAIYGGLFAVWLLLAAIFLVGLWRDGEGKNAGARWLVILLCLNFIVAFASGGAGGSDPMVAWFMRRGFDANAAHAAVIILRKTIHFTFYASVAYSATRAAVLSGDALGVARRFGLGFSLLLAVFDEVRQLTAIGRTGNPWDVGLDMCGAAVGIWLASRRIPRTKPETTKRTKRPEPITSKRA